MESVYADLATAPVSEQVRAALGLIETFTRRPADLDTDDIHRARTAGLSDEAIGHVFDVAAMFNVIDRLADALAFHVPDEQTFEKDARILLRFGYRFPRFLWPRRST